MWRRPQVECQEDASNTPKKGDPTFTLRRTLNGMKTYHLAADLSPSLNYWHLDRGKSPIHALIVNLSGLFDGLVPECVYKGFLTSFALPSAHWH